AIVAAAGAWMAAAPGAAQDARSAPEPSVLGDANRDLVFTPVAPCRAIDTRFAAGGKLVAGVPRDFDIAGTLSDQGGLTDCLIPFGPATAIAVNLVAVAPSGAGNLRAWAFGDPVPNAAVLNYGVVSGLGALANGVILPLCNPASATCTRDLTIRADVGDVHLVADVTGYYSAPSSLAIPWSSVTGKPAGFADGVDNDTTYSAGFGLNLVGTQFAADTGEMQARVTGLCGAGSAIASINSAGGVTCEFDNDTTYSAGFGINLSGTAFSADTTEMQRRVTGTCPDSAIRTVSASGTVTCAPTPPAIQAGRDITGTVCPANELISFGSTFASTPAVVVTPEGIQGVVGVPNTYCMTDGVSTTGFFYCCIGNDPDTVNWIAIAP
ncbi:MAG TPA: hypothetical protein VIG50_13415, partial [Vicinamibacteria bacterium]